MKNRKARHFPLVMGMVALCAARPGLTIADDKKPGLTPMQMYVVHGDGTEPAFRNKYWDHKEDGIYVDVLSGEPLFSSTDKFDSGTGWPSFTRPISDHNIVRRTDTSMGMDRTEVRSASGAHLGHVFNDGPPEKGGLRFCINSASLRFVPKDRLVIEGYAEYASLFAPSASADSLKQLPHSEMPSPPE